MEFPRNLGKSVSLSSSEASVGKQMVINFEKFILSDPRLKIEIPRLIFIDSAQLKIVYKIII